VVYQIVASPDDAPGRLKVPSLSNRQSRFDAHPIVLWVRTIIATELLLAAPFIALMITRYKSLRWFIITVKALHTFSITLATSFQLSLDEALRQLQPYHALSTLAKRFEFKTTFSAGHLYTKTAYTKAAVLQDFYSISMVSAVFNHARMVASNGLVLALTQIATIFFPALYEACWISWLNDRPQYTKFIDVQVPPLISTALDLALFPSLFIGFYRALQSTVFFFSRRKPCVPRKPDSLGSNMAYLANSPRLLEKVRGTSMVTKAQRNSKIMEEQSLTFEFGWIMVEGEAKLGVDVGGVMERYKFG